MKRSTNILGSACASHAGDGALAIANLSPFGVCRKDCFGEAPKPACEAHALPGQMLRRAVAFAFLFCAISLSAFAQTQEQIASHAGLEQKLNAQVPLDAVFRDEHGKAVPLGNFFRDGKPVMLALAYYECPNLCTLVLNGVLQTAQELKFDAGKEYEIVIVSFDARERPALAAAKKQTYIEKYHRPGANDGWHFLTGDKDAIARLTSSVGYRFAYDEATRQFAHPSAIMVLTPGGKVARYFPGIEYPPRDVRLALIDASNEHIGSVTDQIFLLCFHYNPATGKYGLLINRVIKIAGVGTAALLAGYIAAMVGRDRRARRGRNGTSPPATSPDGPAVRPYHDARS